jgi:putative phosphoserine phosphatase/1-acylglycerol-3-phosphate O-acyltransferase
MINFSTALWADMTCALIGLKVSVDGAEHLQSPRPAVFILNHQSNADGFLVAKLTRRDIAYMGKQELSRQFIRGRLMRWGGLILVDRENASKAGAATQAMIGAIRHEGLSAALFPEGRRTHSTELGRFRKGAFLIALKARVPIIPIVIHNSIDAQPKGQRHYTPAHVKVEVLPPIDTANWSVGSIEKRIEEVRQLYQETLSP